MNKEKRKEYNKKYREKNKEKLKILNKKYNIDNKEEKKEYNKKYREENKEKIQLLKKIHYENNKQQIIEYKKQYNENNKEKAKKYYEKNKELISEKKKEWNENNRDKIKKYNQKNGKIYYENNKDKLIKRSKEYYENNKDKKKEYTKKYYGLIKLKCKSCEIFLTKKKNNFLCSYCNPDKPTRQKTKELKVKTFLEENNYTFIHNKKCNIDNRDRDSSQTYYPDFLIDCNTFFLIIECDEDAHKSYPIDSEKIRENNICYALGLPCVFIRFNPDKKGIKMKTKQKVLKSYIDYYISKENSFDEVCYLFY